MMHQFEMKERNRRIAYGEPIPTVRMFINSNTPFDLRRYNRAKANEIAVVFVKNDGSASSPSFHDILIVPRYDAIHDFHNDDGKRDHP